MVFMSKRHFSIKYLCREKYIRVIKNKKVFARIFDVLTETLKTIKEAVLCWILSPSSIESEMA